MNDNDIIKALECCANEDASCSECPIGRDYDCRLQIASYALETINRQQAEIERIRALVEEAYSLNEELIGDVDNKLKYIYELEDKLNAEKADVMYFKDQIRADAILEFAERSKIAFVHGVLGMNSVAAIIDNLVKEMTEGQP